MKKLIALAALLAVTAGIGVGLADNGLDAGNSLKVRLGNSLNIHAGNSL